MKEDQRVPSSMERKDEATEAIINTSYEDFEPYCKWQREEGCDILELHLQDFEKEQLRVQLKKDILIVTGERRVNNNIRNRFRKEIRISKHCKTTEIRAKLSSTGILTISLPKMSTSATSKRLGGSNENGNLSASMPSVYLAGQESSSKYWAKLNAKLAGKVAGVAVALAFGGFVYNYCWSAHAD